MNEDGQAPVSTEAGAAAPAEGVQEDVFDTRSPADIAAEARADANANGNGTGSPAADDGEGEEGEEEGQPAPTPAPTGEPAAPAPAAAAAPSQEPAQPTAAQVAKQVEITLPTKEDGTLDLAALPKFVEDVAAMAQAKAEKVISDRMYIAQEQESVETAYPTLAKNPERMKIVENLRLADVLNGGKGDLMEAAKLYMDDRGEAVQQGKQSQQRSIRRQKSATLETAGRTGSGDAAKLQRLTKEAFNGTNRASRDNARLERLKMLRESGALNA